MQGKIRWSALIRKLSPYTIQKGIRYFRHYGPKEFWVRLHERFEPEEVPYGEWYEAARPDDEELAAQRRKKFPAGPLISILVPVYRTPELFLGQMIDSVLAQTYGNWELCIANASPEDEAVCRVLNRYQQQDARIRVENLPENDGIAANTNRAAAMARGAWLGFLDHDDLLAPQALFAVAEALQKKPEACLIYSDEDKVTADLSEHFQPHFKPGFNLDLLRSNNYICHFLLVRREVFEEVGGISPDYDGAQDHDFVLRCAEQALGSGVPCFDERVQGLILRIPQVLYHWRTHQSSTADNPDSKQYAYEAGCRAVADHLRRMGTRGQVLKTLDHGFYRVRYEVQGMPLVSIIIPNKDHAELLSTCIRSLREKTTYSHYEILVVDNETTQPEALALYEELRGEGVRVLSYPKPFNYAAINNLAAREAAGEYLVFLNNDIEIVTPDWLQELLGVCQRPEVGVAGVRLVYPNHTVQHAGIVMGIGGIAGAMFVDMPEARTGYLHKASILQDLSAVTAACMMADREAFFSVEGFTEELAVAFNDVDLCLKLRQQGYLIVYDPYVQHIHNESASRGAEDSEEKVRRFQSEIEYMRTHWIRILKEGDPFYNPNLSLTKWNYSPAMPEKKRRS